MIDRAGNLAKIKVTPLRRGLISPLHRNQKLLLLGSWTGSKKTLSFIGTSRIPVCCLANSRHRYASQTHVGRWKPAFSNPPCEHMLYLHFLCTYTYLRQPRMRQPTNVYILLGKFAVVRIATTSDLLGPCVMPSVTVAGRHLFCVVDLCGYEAHPLYNIHASWVLWEGSLLGYLTKSRLYWQRISVFGHICLEIMRHRNHGERQKQWASKRG